MKNGTIGGPATLYHHKVVIDTEYIRTPTGILKLIQLAIGIILYICVGVTWAYQLVSGGFLNFSTSVAFISTLFLFLAYLFKVIYSLPGPWILIELILTFIFIGLFLISLIICAVSAAQPDLPVGFGLVTAVNVNAAAAASFFYFFNIVAYGIEAFFLYRLYTMSNGYHDAIEPASNINDTRPRMTTYPPQHSQNVAYVSDNY